MDTPQGEAVVETPAAEEATVPTEEVASVEGEEEVTLPSDVPEFEVPEKFKGKSTEDIIKSYLELEKMKGGDTESQEEKVSDKPTEETSPEEAQYQKYAESLDKNGQLSEAEYAELAEAGYDRATVDAEIQRRQELKEFEEYKREKTLNELLEPLGGGMDKFKEVSDWANTTKSKEEMEEFNKALASVPKLAQQAMLRQLYSEYESASNSDTILHTNTPQTSGTKGYKSEADFFNDISKPEYQTHKSYAEAVAKKLAMTDTTGWAIG
jgi:hypothetical protein